MKLYYTIEIEYEDEFLTGDKLITVYKIQNNEPSIVLELYLDTSDNSEEFIKDELEELDIFQDEKIELILL